jgi:hypothetical protein
LAIAAVLIAPTTALAHTYILQPPPRDVAVLDLNARAHKTGPCGGVPRIGPPVQYQPGETITVKFEETINHTGCFQIAFSAADDQNFVTLKQLPDTQGVQVYTTQVTLPAGVSCPSCTLQVRQLMLEGTANPVCAPDAAPPDGTAGLGSTYFSCADICVGPVCADAGAPGPDAGAPTDAGTSSGGPSTVPTDGGGKMVPPGSSGASGATSDSSSGSSGGCTVGLGATTGASLVLTAGLFCLALVRRRRRGDA